MSLEAAREATAIIRAKCRGDSLLEQDAARRISNEYLGSDPTISSSAMSEHIAEKLIVGSLRAKISRFKHEAARNGDDDAKKALRFIAQLVVEPDDGARRLTSAKARALSMRRASLVDAAKMSSDAIPVLRKTKKARSDKLNLAHVVEELWHSVTEEVKGKSRRCFVRRSRQKDADKHRVHYSSGTVDDLYRAAMETTTHTKWKDEMKAAGRSAYISKRRFQAHRCFCVRPASRKYCTCWVHDATKEFVHAVVLKQAKWHIDAEVPCECSDSCMVTSLSLYDLGRITTCGYIQEITINKHVTDISTYTAQRFECVAGSCDRCADSFPSCPILWDTTEVTSWRQYERVIKLKRGQKLDRNGLLPDGTKPSKSRELTKKEGTRYQMMSEFKRHMATYAVHNYWSVYDTRLTSTLPHAMLKSHLLMWVDFSAYANLRFENELTCQQGTRCSLYTGVSLFGSKHDVVTGYATDTVTTSHLFWNDDQTQDHAAVGAYRAKMLQKLRQDTPNSAWTLLYEVSDKCAGQFRSRYAARECSQWLTDQALGFKTLIRIFKVTGHSSCSADGEGGSDKRCVYDFIADPNELTWRKRVNGKWPQNSEKPIVNNAAMATWVAKEVRGTTKYQRLQSEGKKARNGVWTINRRHHYDTSHMSIDHSKSKFNNARIPQLNSYFCWRLEHDKPGVLFLRRRACICSQCVQQRWESCELLALGEGGPGEWVEHKMSYPNAAGPEAKRVTGAAGARSQNFRLRKSCFVVLSRNEAFNGKRYGIARVLSRGGSYATSRELKLQDGSVASVGDEVLDVVWFNRVGEVGLTFSETDVAETVLASRVVQVRVQWAKRAVRRRGARETMSELSASCDDAIMNELGEESESDDAHPADSDDEASELSE